MSEESHLFSQLVQGKDYDLKHGDWYVYWTPWFEMDNPCHLVGVWHAFKADHPSMPRSIATITPEQLADSDVLAEAMKATALQSVIDMADQIDNGTYDQP